jgi:AraC-like DNA-binding protein
MAMGDRARGGWPNRPPPWLRSATDFIEQNAHADITLADVAGVAHVTPRALQMAFRRRLATTPRGYLLNARLERAHEELANSAAAATTVAEVAHHWGFRHPGRFARHYREKYGCYPEATLKAPREVRRRAS